MHGGGARAAYKPDRPGHEHAGGALGRRTMATAAEPERSPWLLGGTWPQCDCCPEPHQRPGRRKLRSGNGTPADRALGWRPLDDRAEQAPAGCDICVPSRSRSAQSPLRLGDRRRRPVPQEHLLHREMERHQLAAATKPEPLGHLDQGGQFRPEVRVAQPLLISGRACLPSATVGPLAPAPEAADFAQEPGRPDKRRASSISLREPLTSSTR